MTAPIERAPVKNNCYAVGYIFSDPRENNDDGLLAGGCNCRNMRVRCVCLFRYGRLL